MHPPLNPSSSLVTHRFTHFNCLLLLLILFLLCNHFGLFNLLTLCILSLMICNLFFVLPLLILLVIVFNLSISVFSSAEPFVFSCISFHPLQLSSLVSNPLPPLQPLCLL